MKTKYAVVIERYDEGGFGAYVPDLPGCIAVGKVKAEVEKLIAEAIAFHIESLREHGNPVPLPSSDVQLVEPAAVA